MSAFAIRGRPIGEGAPAYIIAEAGSNHDGSLEKAKRLIAAAAGAGADAVKFQLFRAERLYPRNVGIVPLPSGDEDFFAVLARMELPESWLGDLSACCRDHGVVFLASAFDEASAAALDALDVAAHKVASPELTHIPLIRTMARSGRPIILSTGMSGLGDIEDALRACRAEGNGSLAILHCTTAYPTPPADANLNALRTLAQAFGCPVGLSDHTFDPGTAPAMAVALGASIIEKHYTLDRRSPGPDHPFALEPGEVRRMVDEVRRVESMDARERRAYLADPSRIPYLGSPRKRPSEAERALAACDRRSIMAIRPIARGDRITAANAAILRAERNLQPGIAPKFWDVIAGRRATRALEAGQGILWDHLLSDRE